MEKIILNIKKEHLDLLNESAIGDGFDNFEEFFQFETLSRIREIKNRKRWEVEEYNKTINNEALYSKIDELIEVLKNK